MIMRFHRVSMLAFALSLLTFAPVAVLAQAAPSTQPAKVATRPTGPARWEPQIAKFEAADRANPPAKGSILFTGSSTIGGWKTLVQDFPDHPVINRGFGGSQIADAAHFAHRYIIPLAPRLVVLRSGSNDIHAGKSAEQVFADYQQFVATVHAKLPDTEILYIALAPAPVRWEERGETKKLNDLVAELTKRTPGLKYVETYDTTVNPDGTPREELFRKDRLHFNAEGYKLLVERVRPALSAATSE